jgi:DNA/RNA-binding protein KIN17
LLSTLKADKLRQAALQKKERATMDGEDRERKMLEDQIARARAAAGADDQAPQGLVRPEGEKVSLSLSFKPLAVEPAGESTDGPSNAEASGSGLGAAPAAASEGPGVVAAAPKISFGGFSSFGKTPVANPLKANPLKRPAAANVFKTAKAPRTDDSDSRGGSGNSGSKGFMSEAERLMKEDQARRNRRAEGGYQGAGPRRGGDVRR